ATPQIYVVATIQANLQIGGVLTLTGFLQISQGVGPTAGTRVVTGAVSGNIGFLGSLTGTLNLVVSVGEQTGIVGPVFLTLNVNRIPGVNLNGQFLLEINTFSTAQTVQTFAIAKDANGNFNGFVMDANGNLQVMQQSIDPGFRLVMSGSLKVASIVNIVGYFSFQLSPSGLDLAVNGTVSLAPLGTVQVVGDLIVDANGLVALIDVSAGIGNFGQDLGLSFSATFLFELNTS